MNFRFTKLVSTAVLLLAGAAASAQNAAPSANYTGHRFPGGPDSLRALVYRSTRLAAPGSTGPMVVQFDLKDGHQPHNFKLVQPPTRVKADLLTASAAALNLLQAKMPSWEPGTPDPRLTNEPQISLPLDFAAALSALPYAYADTNPVFPDAVALVPETRFRSVLDYSRRSLVRYIQINTRYPAEALRAHQQGTVQAYFEVAENGAIEHTQIVGTAGNALDAEVLRVLNTIPQATKPALLQGRPVRVYYVLPIVFRAV